MSVIIEFTGEMKTVSRIAERVFKVEAVNTSSIVIRVENIELKDIELKQNAKLKSIELRLNAREEQTGIESEVKHIEPSWKTQRIKSIQEAREKGKKIKLSFTSATIIIYNDKVYLDRCWPSDYTIVSNALSLDYVMQLIDRVRLMDLERAKSVVRDVLQTSNKVTIRRLARSECAVNALAELAVKVHRGEARL